MMKSITIFMLNLLLVSFANATENQPLAVNTLQTVNSSLAVIDADIRSKTPKIIAKKIILIGDSTMQPLSGWGGAFCAYHLKSIVACINLARGGRSTFDYQAEGSWDIALDEMRMSKYAKTYVLIQFGHNDQPGRPGRSTDLITEYPENLRNYVKDVRMAGAIPILVTPLATRIFKNGLLQDTLEPWANSMRKVSEELNVPLIDLHKTSFSLVQSMGAVTSMELAQLPPPIDFLTSAMKGTSPPIKIKPRKNLNMHESFSNTSQASPTLYFDYTHIGDKGAKIFSAIIANELAKTVPDLKNDLIP